MQPNGQTPLPPQQNPYDYILNPAVAPKKKSFVFGNGGKPNKLVMVLFVLIVLTIVIVGFSVFNNLTKKNYNSVIDLAARQTEIVRIADLGLDKAHDPATLIYVSTIRNVTLSEKTATQAFLIKKNSIPTTQQLLLKRDTTIDSALTAAEQDNTYDQTLLSKLNDLLDSYQKAEKNITGYTDTKSETTLVTTLLANAKIISGAKN